MMRSPNYVAVAVRRPDRKIVIKYEPYSTVFKKMPFLRKPLLRGVVTLVESMVQGIGALSFSAEIGDESADANPAEKPMTRSEVISSMLMAFVMAMLLFVALPHGLTVLLSSERALGISVDSPVFHLIDGLFKMLVLLTYVYLISRIEEIGRVFQYHGAEHQSIYAFEAGEPLEVESARRFTTLHPRCGTSFLLFLVMISIVFFSILLPSLGLTRLSAHPWLNHTGMIVAKIGFMFPVAGVAYEVIKWSARHVENPALRWIMVPGLWLQNLTTRVPSGDQLEVALISLRQVLALEKSGSPEKGIRVVDGIADVTVEPVAIKEFLEA